MKIKIVNSWEYVGGAAIAAYRLCCGLQRLGIDANMVTLPSNEKKLKNTQFLSFGNDLLGKAFRLYRKYAINKMDTLYQPRPGGYDVFSYGLSCFGPCLIDAISDADILNFHWVSFLLDYPYVLPRIKPELPVVWTFHDMNAFTGGCHYSLNCGRYKDRCGMCPQLNSQKEEDLSSSIWRRKSKALQKIRAPLAIVTPSKWLAKEVKQSSLFNKHNVEVIPNGINIEIFQPRDKANLRKKYGLPSNVEVLLFGAAQLNSIRKGFKLLLEALRRVKVVKPNAQIVYFGDSEIEDADDLNLRYLGNFSDEFKISEVYNLADIFIISSVQDNLPNVLLESISCGVPVAGFSVGGISEVIEHGVTGWLADDISLEGLVECILRLLDQVGSRKDHYRQNCRIKAEKEYNITIQVDRYQQLFHKIRSTTSRL